ncbi:MAG: hypothetical protein Q8O89_07060 [Nanoarchaeota archaeon]|nr:hypothetical protein [Nanoarchaeota archaeon]
MKRLFLLLVFLALFSSLVAAENETVGLQKIMASGDTATVNVNGAQAVVTLVGVNSDALTAMITINGESKQLRAGQTDTLGGVRIYLKQVYSYSVAMKSGAELFIGSNLTITSPEDIQKLIIPEKPVEIEEEPKHSIYETLIMTAGDCLL